MKLNEMRAATNEKLIRRFEELATIHGELRTAKEANRAFREEGKVWEELQKRGLSATTMFLRLLESSNPVIRLSAAAKALSVAPEEALPVLRRLTNEPGFVGFTASMTVEEWRVAQSRRRSDSGDVH